MNKKFIVLGIALIFIALTLPLTLARDDGPDVPPDSSLKFPITDLYPEDTSFRSGLAYKITYYNEFGIKVKEEKNIWQTRYPFNDPKEARNPYRFNEPVTENIGFKVSIIRYPSKENVRESGRLSYTLAVIPYLAAKETIIYDDSGIGNYQTFGTFTEFDRYGNAKEIHNLGYTGKKPGETFTEPVYYEYKVRNPLRNDGKFPYTVSSEFTNLQTNPDYPIKPLAETGIARKDNSITYNEFVYEIGGEDPEIAGHASISGRYPIGSTSLLSEKDTLALYGFYGMTGIPKRTIVKDAYGRVLSDLETEFETVNANFEGCTQNNHIEGNRCLIKPGFGEFKSLNPFDGSFFIDSGTAGEFCLRIVPRKLSSYGTAAGGYIASASGDKEHIVSSNIELTYDDCGNNVQLDVGANYVLPGTSSILTYSKKVRTEYDNLAVKPTSVTTFATPGSGEDNIVKSATYYKNNLLKTTINERGVETNYAYDTVGRISAVWTAPDTNISPTIKYEYNPGWEGSLINFRNVILAERKNTNGLYTKTYYHYNGMGRFSQSKTLNDVGTPGDASDDSVTVVGKKYDVAGRVIRDFRPKSFNLADVNSFASWDKVDDLFKREGIIGGSYGGPAVFIADYILHEFDSQGREVRTTDLADGSFTTNDYGLLGDFVVSSFFSKVATTDPKGNIRTFYSDARGGLVKVVLPTP